jgi:hypothetical protein
MAGRVNLNVPPRLIESARAAQYANREAQGARELARRIEGKVRQQRQAAKRAQPQAQTAEGQGAVFDAPASKRVPRIWRKRRPLGGGNGYGIGYIVIYDTPYGNNKFRIYAPNGTAYAEIDETAVGFVPNPSGNHLGITGISGVGLSENEVCVSVTGGNGPSKVYWTNFTNWTFLPAGNGNAVFIFSSYWAYIDFYLIFNAQTFGLNLGGYVDGLKLVQKAFFVSSNAVQEITVGGGFKAFTENALLPEVWSNVRLLECGTNEFIGMIRLPNFLAPAPGPGSKPLGAGSIGRSLDPYDRSFDYYSPVRFGDLDSGGIAPLLGFGPGIYSYLANPAAANAAVNAAGDGPWAKQTAAEQFIGADLLPSGSLADSSINPKKSLLYTGTYPPANRPFGTMSQFSETPAAGLLRYNLTPINGVEDPLWSEQPEELEDSVLYREPFGGDSAPGPGSPFVPNTSTTPILFWDWDDADYCERQLLRLGFSEADLTP